MLPIFRILPVGGVLLAIILLVLALNPPDGSRTQMAPSAMRGALIARDEHPEWREFLMLAAIRRADELNRLRELPDTPARTDAAPAPPKVAGLPAERSNSDPEAGDETGSIVQPPAATIPIDIGEPSAFELPVTAPEERPPVITVPQQVKSRNESRITRPPRAHRARAAGKAKPAAPFDFFQPTFGANATAR